MNPTDSQTHRSRKLAMSTLAAFVICAASVSTLPQQPRIFRSTSALIEVDAVVTDNTGAVVRGLTHDDFVLTDNGVPQTIAQFSFVDLPPPSAPASEALSDVVSNEQSAAGRLYVILMDAFHIDPSRSTVARKLARQFVETGMGPKDMAAVLQLGQPTLNQPFTSDKALLIASIERFIGRQPESETSSVMRDAMLRPQTPGAPAEDAQSGARANEAQILLQSITQVCQRLGTVQGHRRSVIIFGEGISYDTSDVIGKDQRPGQAGYLLSFDPAKHAGEVLSAEAAMLEAARRADVTLYTVDPRGGTMGDEEIMQAQATSGASFTHEAQRGQGTMRTFASETGGFAVVGTNDFKSGFSRIVQANSSYYVLGYSPIASESDGAYHRIGVTVKSREVRIAARKGYFAIAGAPSLTSSTPRAASNETSITITPSARMRELLTSQLPVDGLGLRLTGGPVRPDGDKVLTAIVMELNTHDIHFTESAGQLSDNVEMAFVALDGAGKIYASSRSVGDLRLPVSQRDLVANGLRYVAEFALPPGRYQVRAAAYEAAAGSAGSAVLDVDTDKVAKGSLSIGSILVTAGPDQSMPTTGSFDVLRGLLPGPPTTTRAFTPHDTLVAFADVSDNGDGSGRKDEISTIVKDETGRQVFTNSSSEERTELSPKKHGAPYVTRVPLSGFAPGHYVLTIGARTPSGKSTSESIEFLVK